MRYFTGFLGGVVVAILLFAFQVQLVAGDHEHVVQPTPIIHLDSVFESRPPDVIDRTPREVPPKPELVATPDITVDPPETHTVRPVPARIPSMFPRGDGAIASIDIDIGRHAVDGGPGLRSAVEPQYPAGALRNGVEGEVEVEFTVRADGSVADVEVIRANPRGVFEQSAVRAVLRWQFTPKRENGVTVPVRTRQVIRFELP